MTPGRDVTALAEQAAQRLRSAPPGGFARNVAPRVYAGLLLLMAYGQSVDMDGFALVLDDYRVGVPSGALALALVSAAWVLGGWLLLVPDLGQRVWSAVFAALSVTWAGLTGQAFVRGLDVVSCGWFGALPPRQELGWRVLVQDAVVLAAAAWFVFAAWRYPGRTRVQPLAPTRVR